MLLIDNFHELCISWFIPLAQKTFCQIFCGLPRKPELRTLESEINIPPGINVAPGKFGKKNKHNPIYTLFLYYLNTK